MELKEFSSLPHDSSHLLGDPRTHANWLIVMFSDERIAND